MTKKRAIGLNFEQPLQPQPCLIGTSVVDEDQIDLITPGECLPDAAETIPQMQEDCFLVEARYDDGDWNFQGVLGSAVRSDLQGHFSDRKDRFLRRRDSRCG